MGSEPTPQDFLRALWAVTAECWRVLKPTGSLFVNLGDKYAGSGGHNNSGISDKSTLRGNGHVGGVGKAGPQKIKSTRRSAPDRYNQETGGMRSKSLMGLPWRYANGCIDGEAGEPWILRRDLIWNKPNGLPESVTDRCRSSHEYWFHLTKEGRYFSAVDEIREDSTGRRQAGGPWLERNEGHILGRDTAPHCGLSDYEPNPLGKLPGSVWTIPSEPLIIPEAVQKHYDLPDHFAAFPQEWPRRLTLGWSPIGVCVECGEGRRPVAQFTAAYAAQRGPGTDWNRDRRGESEGYDGNGDRRSTAGRPSAKRVVTGYACACPEPTAPTKPAVVLDPFGGTGTVCGVARALGRVGISLDLSMDYCRLARWRVERSGHFAKTASRTDAERQGALL